MQKDLAEVAERSSEFVGDEVKRIAVDIPVKMHNDIKINAAHKNIKFKTYVIRALVKELALDEDLGY